MKYVPLYLVRNQDMSWPEELSQIAQKNKSKHSKFQQKIKINLFATKKYLESL